MTFDKKWDLDIYKKNKQINRYPHDKIVCSTNNNYDLKTVVDIKLSLTPEPFKHWTKKEIFEQYESSLRIILFSKYIGEHNSCEIQPSAISPHFLVISGPTVPKYIGICVFLGVKGLSKPESEIFFSLPS